MNHGIETLYFFSASFKPSHNSSNKHLCESNPISNVPFGPLCPSLVPCPPAIVTAASFPFFIASIPIDS